MLKTKKLFLTLMGVFVAFLLFPKTALAAEDAIASIDIEVELQEDGTAIITEVWDIINTYDGTEYYIVMNLPNSMTVHSLEVWDGNGRQFETLDAWDVDASFQEKAFRAGIVERDQGYELCWGISHLGDNTFTVRYVLTNLVQDYRDFSGFYHQFVTHDLSSAPESVSVMIRMNGTKFSESNTNAWLQGFDGEISFTNDGAIFAISDGALSSSDYVSVVAQFDHSSFNPAIINDADFESILDNELTMGELVLILGFIAIFSGGSGLFIHMVSSRMKLSDGTTVKKPRMKEVEPTNLLPFGGSLPATYCALHKVRSFTQQALGTTAFSSYLVKWEYEGIIEMEEIDDEKVNILFDENRKPLTKIELELYHILLKVAGTNKTLTSKKLEKWKDGHEKILKWEKKLMEVGEKELLATNMVEPDHKGKICFTRKGYEQTFKLWGFMKFLKETKTLDQENDLQRDWWGNYLIFATMLGMTQDMRKYFASNPDAFDHSTMHMFNMMLLTSNVNNSFYHDTNSDASGIGGGGGFSGGGGGGGSR